MPNDPADHCYDGPRPDWPEATPATDWPPITPEISTSEDDFWCEGGVVAVGSTGRRIKLPVKVRSDEFTSPILYVELPINGPLFQAFATAVIREIHNRKMRLGL